MIFDLLDALANPQNYACKIDREGIHLAPVAVLRAQTMTKDLVAQLYDIATNEAFSPDQRRELMAIAIDDHTQAQADNHPTSLAIDRALNVEQMDVGIRISTNAGVPIGS